MSNEPTLIAVLPAGRYIVGDPCYSIGADHADWMTWLEAADYGQNDRNHVLVAPYNGHLCVGVSTAYGDGEYADNLGNLHGVDAGLIGVVHVDAADCESVSPPVVVDFPDEFECYYDDQTIVLGHVRIYTGDSCDCGEPINGGMQCRDCEEYEAEYDDLFEDDEDLV